MKPIVYTRHARRALRFWRISLADVVATLEHPDSVIPSEKGRSNAIRQMGSRYLRVTYIEEGEHILVITITPRKRPW